MSRRDGQQADQSSTDAPADSGAPEPVDLTERPNEVEDESPAGEEAEADQGQRGDSAQADDGDADDEQPQSPDDWRKKYETTEQKRRDYESRAAKAETRAKQLDEYVPQLNSWWESLIEREAPELHAKIQAEKRRRSDGDQASKAVTADSYAVINGVYRDGDKAFGDYLTTLVEDAGVKVSRQSLEKHRRTYDSIKGGSNGNGHSADAPATARSRDRGEDTRPPRVPSAGRMPTDAGARPWKPGDAIDVRGNISRGLREGSARRQASGRR